jgi:ComF family protein
MICRKCRAEVWDLDGVYSIFEYGGTIRQAIIQLKYHNIKTLAEPLSVYLSEYLKQHRLSFDIIVPVPIHRRKLNERGYNQTSLLAGRLGYLTHIPVMERILIRTRYTRPQAKSDSVEQRRENTRNSFKCVSRNVSGKRVLLIDDVCTSGATLNSCAASLKSAGAASVWGLTLAKEI